MLLKTEGIVLKTFDLRETSRIATFFTKDHGKIKGVFKGIRRDIKKYGSNIDKFSVNDIVYYWHRGSDLHLVGQCDLKQFFFPIRKDIKRMMAAQYALELVDAVMPPEEENRKVYQLMMRYLEGLQDIHDINKLVHIFQIKILHLSGFRPHIDDCVVCQKHIHKNVRFSMRLGGLICFNCLSNDPTSVAVSKGTVASMLHIEKSDWNKTLRLGLSASIKREFKRILNSFLVFHLERQIKTAKYLS